jgi:hypothetical protein
MLSDNRCWTTCHLQPVITGKISSVRYRIQLNSHRIQEAVCMTAKTFKICTAHAHVPLLIFHFHETVLSPSKQSH